MNWNPLFVAYASAHGMNPDEQIVHDLSVWPGGLMAGFIIWMSARIQEFNRHVDPRSQSLVPPTSLHPEAFGRYVSYVAELWGGGA